VLIRPAAILDARPVILLLAAVLAAAAPAAFAAAPHTRSEALAALKDADPQRRAEAVVWLADRGAPRDAGLLHERLRDEDEGVRGIAEQGLWRLWGRSGDREVDARMEEAAQAMQAGEYPKAIEVLTAVIRKKPAFAEGWNRRATVYYLAGEFEKSIADCDEVLRRNPLHFGALSGLGQIHAQLEHYDEALKWFRRALEVNPNMAGVEVNIEAIRALQEQRRGKAI